MISFSPGYDLGVISGALPQLIQAFDLSRAQQEFVVSISYVRGGIGAAYPSFSDRLQESYVDRSNSILNVRVIPCEPMPDIKNRIIIMVPTKQLFSVSVE